jgi:hypothetical protein
MMKSEKSMDYKLFWTEEAVLSKQTTVFYEFKENIIYLTFLFVNRKNIIGIK